MPVDNLDSQETLPVSSHAATTINLFILSIPHAAFAELDPGVFGRGTNGLIQDIWLCLGTEDKLIDCTRVEHSVCGANPNDPREVAGLYCFGKVFSIALLLVLV